MLILTISKSLQRILKSAMRSRDVKIQISMRLPLEGDVLDHVCALRIAMIWKLSVVDHWVMYTICLTCANHWYIAAITNDNPALHNYMDIRMAVEYKIQVHLIQMVVLALLLKQILLLAPTITVNLVLTVQHLVQLYTTCLTLCGMVLTVLLVTLVVITPTYHGSIGSWIWLLWMMWRWE